MDLNSPKASLLYRVGHPITAILTLAKSEDSSASRRNILTQRPFDASGDQQQQGNSGRRSVQLKWQSIYLISVLMQTDWHSVQTVEGWLQHSLVVFKAV